MDVPEERADQPSELAMSYSERIRLRDPRIDVLMDDLRDLTRWECHVLTKSAFNQGYTAHWSEWDQKLWLTRP